MKSNKQWLDELAATDPQALQAWFDAPRGGLDAPRADCEQVDGNDEKISFDVPLYGWKDSVSVDTDSREQLEADVREWVVNIGWLSDEETQVADFIAWLDRQAAITRAECDKPNWEYCETCDYERANKRQARKIENVCALNDELTRKLDSLAHDLAESERLREEMREELSIAYDHAHDLLARRDRGLA